MHKTHGGICRKCHSNSVPTRTRRKIWRECINRVLVCNDTSYLSNTKEDVKCFTDHLIDFCQRKLIEF
jgi:hypothetical protein